MSIKNYAQYFDKQASPSNHAPFFPPNIFAIMSGSTGCGKTNLLLNLLLEDGFLDYGSVHVHCPTLHQPAYQFLVARYGEMEKDIQKKYHVNIKIAHFHGNDTESILDPKELNPDITHILVFDDMMLDDQTQIKEYFCRGRHNNVNIFYLCQSLHKIAKHCIRENANVFILFHQDDKTLKYFHETHISGDMGFKEFKAFCDDGWSRKHGFVVINVWEESHCGRFISNYEQIYTPTKFRLIPINTN